MSNLCKILIVEDEVMTRQALKYIIGIENENFKIIGEASNGKEALNIIEKEIPDVIITDIVMPIIDGIELTKMIKLKYPKICTIILSSHGDFKYVKSTFQYGIFDYILKPELEPQKLLHILHNASQCLGIVLCQELKQNLISGKMLEDLREIFSYSLFSIIGCELKYIEGYVKSEEAFYTEVIVETISKYQSDYFYYNIIIEESILYVIFNFEEAFQENVQEICEKMMQEIYHQISSLFLVVGIDFNDFSKLSYRMSTIKELLNLKFYLYDKPVIFEKELSKIKKQVQFDRKNYEEKIGCYFFEEGFRTIIDFLEQIDYTTGIKEIELKKIVENTLYNTFNILEELDFEIDELSTKKMNMLSQISSAKNIDMLRERVKCIIQSMIQTLDKQNRIDKINVLSQIIEYVDTYYNEQITLHTVADAFHLSYSYLSYYFSTSLNKGFNEYLNEVRINKAKQLLSSSDIAIANISEAVGYADQSYFSKVFKKVTTYSPSQYRRISYKKGM